VLCARLSWPFCRLLSARKYIVSYVLGRITAIASNSGLLLQTESVGLLVTFVSPVKTAEVIEMPFGELTHVGPRKHVLMGPSLD